MSRYIKHLEQMYSKKTFNRKIGYIKYNFSDLIDIKSEEKYSVLEIGPGMGEFVCYLNKLGVKNIDVVDNDREILKRINNKHKIRKTICTEDVSKLSGNSGKYDLVIMIQVLEHISPAKYTEVLSMLYASLKPLGKLIIVVPNAGNPLGLVERYADLQHYISFTEQSLKDLVGLSGIKDYSLSLQGFEIPPYSLINVARIFLQKTLHLLLFFALVINGGNFFRIMTPNISVIVKKNA